MKSSLLDEIKSCTLCIDTLPLQPKPILQFTTEARILIVGQAPGRAAHESGIPWNDPSGERLRQWLGIKKELFYNERIMAIMPMGFCYPGKAASGDLPPRPECRARWIDSVLAQFEQLDLILLVGQHATHYFLGTGNIEDHIKNCVNENGQFIVLPHPSPRNNIWLAKNDWFIKYTLPVIRSRVQLTINQGA